MMLGNIDCQAGDFNADLSGVYDPWSRIVLPREDVEVRTHAGQSGDGAVGNSGLSRLELNQDSASRTPGWWNRVGGAINRFVGAQSTPASPRPLGRGLRGRILVPP